MAEEARGIAQPTAAYDCQVLNINGLTKSNWPLSKASCNVKTKTTNGQQNDRQHINAFSESANNKLPTIAELSVKRERMGWGLKRFELKHGKREKAEKQCTIVLQNVEHNNIVPLKC